MQEMSKDLIAAANTCDAIIYLELIVSLETYMEETKKRRLMADYVLHETI